MRIRFTLALLVLFATSTGVSSQSRWAHIDEETGKLVYGTTERGDRMLDFSHAGYMGGGVRLPDVPEVLTIGPRKDVTDYTALIQAAIDEVSSLPLRDGFRGAVRLLPGEYPCSETIRIETDGVVLRGSGSPADKQSTIRMFGESRHSAVMIGTSRRQKKESSSEWVQTRVTDAYVPAGSCSFHVKDPSLFKVGDAVLMCKPVTEKWIRHMHMDDMYRDGKHQTWIKVGTQLRTPRVISAIDGNRITLSVPLPDSYDREFTDDRTLLAKAPPTRSPSRCGIENLRIISPNQAVSHTVAKYFGIRVAGEDCWLKDIDLYETMESVGATGQRITFRDVHVIRKALHQGSSRPAEFAPNASQILLDRCSVEGDNLWFVATGAQVSGPIVLLNCSFEGNGNIEGHQRWTTGLLVDNCRVPDGSINFMNRGSMGSGHGWAMAWAVAWNCTAKSFLNQLPPGTCNWVIGSIGEKAQRARPFDKLPLLPEAIYDSHGTRVAPGSLYLAQLKERLGEEALANIGYGTNLDPDLKRILSRLDGHWTELKMDDDRISSRHKHNAERKEGYFSGAIMGNGLIGTNLYKLDKNVYRLNVGRSDVTEQREGYSLYNKGRLPIGYFTLSTAGNVMDEAMTLSLYDAETKGSFTTSAGKIDFKTYVHACRNIIVFETESTGQETGFSWDFHPLKAISPRVFNRADTPEGYLTSTGCSNPEPFRIDEEDVHFLVQPLALDTTFTRMAGYYAVAWKENREGDSRRIIASVSMKKTIEETLAEARDEIDSAFLMTGKELESEHEKWWHDFYSSAARLSIPDERFERFYWMQYYKLASTARPGRPIVDLQGVWPTWDTPWTTIWCNLNLQLTYSFQTKANLGWLAQPLWDALWENRDNLTRNVTDIPGQKTWTDAACLPRTATYDFHSPLNPAGAATNQYEVGNLAWTLHYYYLQCLAYGDRNQMKERVFPLLKAAINLFFHIRKVNEDGTYSLPETASPEYLHTGVGPNTNYDLANLRQGLTTLLQIDSVCRLNDPMVPQWKDFLSKMPDFQYSGTTGFKVSETTEFINTSHRHYSHLFMIYPYHMLDMDDPVQKEKAMLSIDRWKGNQGYSRTGKAAMLACLGDGDGALREMDVFLDTFIQPNTLYTESGPVIETPFAAMSTLQEFYMQDWGDRIRVFYGCPSAWKNASFSGMRAAGAFLMSAERRDGVTTMISVTGEQGGRCQIETDIDPRDVIVSSCNGQEKPCSISTRDEVSGVWTVVGFDTSKGETVEIKNKRF